MKSIFETRHATEITDRIDRLREDSTPLWGTMQVSQMLAHCAAFHDIPLGNTFPPRGLLGRLVGRFAKPMFYNEKPLPQNMSTIPTIVIDDDRVFETEKEKLKEQITTFQVRGPDQCSHHPHPFFGKLTPEQWGKGIYKHLDHHLKQFGV
ncbi:hypothetical protein ABIE27_003411 [Paenibacillus sp. 4624]|jgi:hypothetical protein|uniref:DUF1569 domain-containing protein n=1 Tax=Paenibacillus amylolyticus TaxID=1451 RepID=A0A5M9WZX7_PAEAM|nr:DUF1569 domain-containing protein [Paenibacillus amylolyticus]KAA8787069.1 DUF1569 domain-containing protein [Paenibacillus amylolyticus]